MLSFLVSIVFLISPPPTLFDSAIVIQDHSQGSPFNGVEYSHKLIFWNAHTFENGYESLVVSDYRDWDQLSQLEIGLNYITFFDKESHCYRKVFCFHYLQTKGEFDIEGVNRDILPINFRDTLTKPNEHESFPIVPKTEE